MTCNNIALIITIAISIFALLASYLLIKYKFKECNLFHTFAVIIVLITFVMVILHSLITALCSLFIPIKF